MSCVCKAIHGCLVWTTSVSAKLSMGAWYGQRLCLQSYLWVLGAWYGQCLCLQSYPWVLGMDNVCVCKAIHGCLVWTMSVSAKLSMGAWYGQCLCLQSYPWVLGMDNVCVCKAIHGCLVWLFLQKSRRTLRFKYINLDP